MSKSTIARSETRGDLARIGAFELERSPLRLAEELSKPLVQKITGRQAG